MTDPNSMKYVCIHGHFYQPPRENPWLEAIEREDSAVPFHDWNERIHCECYRANTAARLVDDTNRILTLRNNYKFLSFNFGPTLIRWIEHHDPLTYRAIIEADKDSCRRFDGHGNAMAQSYNHLIMPLANHRDKITQVLWGIRDFEWRFGRRPEGMWLAETAVDRETLQVMAEAGIKFTVLSPFQASRWRFFGKRTWEDAGDGKIPTGRPYRYDCGNGKEITLFFYDAALARGIAFEKLLGHSSNLLQGIDTSFAARSSRDEEPWLVHTATDGESYGHHFKFGDMALAAAFRELEQQPQTRICNYSSFLASFPPRAQVEIFEKTAWSCSHGLGRWQEDCGCHLGGEPGWNQKWRGPLRRALNFLRDAMAEHYEKEMSRICQDPWAARNDYIDVLLDPGRFRDDFILRHAGSDLGQDTVQRALQLLEMQRCSMLMFTSCGWFFDEISGLESVMILKYASRALQLAEKTGLTGLEPTFLKLLEKAPSNVPEYANGAKVYLEKVKPEVVSGERIVASYAIQTLAKAANHQYKLYTYGISPQNEENLGATPAPCLYGHVRVADTRTLEEEAYVYAVVHFGALDFRCSVKPYGGGREYGSILRSLQQAVEEQNTVGMMRVLDDSFGKRSFSLHDMFKDLRSASAIEISQKMMSAYTELYRHLYQVSRPMIQSLRQWNIQVPADLQVVVKRVLSDEVAELVKDLLIHERETTRKSRSWQDSDFFYRAHIGRLHSVLKDAHSWGLVLQMTKATTDLGNALVRTLLKLRETFGPGEAGKFYRLIHVCRSLGVKPELWRLQTLYFDLVGKLTANGKAAGQAEQMMEFWREMDDFLECRFARFFSGDSLE